jgi:hypothetical protein
MQIAKVLLNLVCFGFFVGLSIHFAFKKDEALTIFNALWSLTFIANIMADSGAKKGTKK